MTTTYAVSTELAPEGSWTKSSYSDQQGGNCVETAATAAVVGVRESKQSNGPAFAITHASWTAFLGCIC
ncbi:DUF397 domain-containing protein [Streptomyces goshikiensis]|uniref:DUF397 domain-containing protein n=1 Tax=Streptomyces goshikiensis TaxID=1942 RepID=UPI0036A5AF51